MVTASQWQSMDAHADILAPNAAGKPLRALTGRVSLVKPLSL